MLHQSVKMQMHEMMRKKTVVFTFFVLLILVMINFYTNMFYYRDTKYVNIMFDPIKLLTLANDSTIGHFLMGYYPLLVVFPTACAYLADKGTRVKVYIETKTGKKNYWYGKLITVFLVTFLVFTIPFLLEVALDGICFSMKAAGDPSNFSYLRAIENTNQYLFYQLYVSHKVLYAIWMTCLFGIVSGILAMFNFAVTTLPIFKYKIFTFFPIYILMYIVSLADQALQMHGGMNYLLVLRMFQWKATMKYTVWAALLVLLLLVSVLLVKFKTIKDDLI